MALTTLLLVASKDGTTACATATFIRPARGQYKKKRDYENRLLFFS